MLDQIRVLVVDDDDDARELTAYFLESSSLEVRTAASAADALSALDDYSPHVILSDIGMPVEDGYALIRRIRALPAEEKKRIPAVAVTAFTRNEDSERALAEGFDVHMAKPVDLPQLLKIITRLTQRRD